MKLQLWQSIYNYERKDQIFGLGVHSFLRMLICIGSMSLGIMVSATRADTIVQFDLNYSVEGDNGPIDSFDVDLYDSEAPITVANFLKYVNNGLYDNTIFHRSVADFVVQGGGFTPTVENGVTTSLDPITNYGTIQNEFSSDRSNVSGTIAMAKVDGNPNSATNQWFVNVADNSSELDGQNGGFTVFGKVLGNGMTLINAINNLQTYDLSGSFGGDFTDVPMFNNGTSFVTITKAAVVILPMPAGSGKLSGVVYYDKNHDGVMDGDDYVLAGAKVSITLAGYSPVTVYTAADGSYSFNNLPAGTFAINLETTGGGSGLDTSKGQMILDKNGNIISIGTNGTALQDAYSNVSLGDNQTGANFNIAQSAYPISLLSVRMLLSSAQMPQANAVAVPSTNVASSSVLTFGNVLVGKPGNATLTVSNLGVQGSSLTGTFPAPNGTFSSAGAAAFGPLGSGQTANQQYTYTPSTRGSSTQDISVATNVGNEKVTLSGTGVAPVNSVTTTAGYGLVSSTGTTTVTVTNTGDGNLSGLGASSNLLGSIAAGSGTFTGDGGSVSLGDSASQTFSYTFAPTVRGAVTPATVTASFTNGNPDGTNTANSQDITLSGTGVAPMSSVTQTPGYALVGSTGTTTVTVTNTGDGNLSGLGASSNLLGSIADGSGSFTGDGGSVSLGDSASQTFSYTFAPTVRGAVTSATVTASFTNGNPDGTNTANSQDITLSGTGVAPIQSVDATAANVGLVRIGTTGTASVTIKNTGDGNLSGLGTSSNLIGAIAASSGTFTGAGGSISLSDNASKTFTFTYAPTARTTDSTAIAVSFTNGSADGKNLAETVNAQLSGQGIGPTYSSDTAPGSTLDFGTVPQADLKSLTLKISNASTDANGGNTSLTDLTLLSAGITGTDSGLFTITGFTAGTVLHEGDLLSLEIDYNGTGEHGDRSAVLTISTDEGAALGANGNAFTYQISAILAPEPSSLLMLAVAGLSLGGLTWSRRTIKRS